MIESRTADDAQRGVGYGQRMLAALEDRAVAEGFRATRLETGSYLPAAIALYRSAGYRPIATYGEYAGNPYSVCFEKLMAASATSSAY